MSEVLGEKVRSLLDDTACTTAAPWVQFFSFFSVVGWWCMFLGRNGFFRAGFRKIAGSRAYRAIMRQVIDNNVSFSPGVSVASCVLGLSLWEPDITTSDQF